MDNINQNINSVAKTSSSLGNVLSGVGIFILGVPAFFVALMFMALSGVGVTPFIFLVVSYGILGYVLGKIKPNLHWKSGLFLLLGAIFVTAAVYSRHQLVDFGDGEAVLILGSLGLIIISSMLGSYFGSRSKRTWQGSISNIIFIIFVLITVYAAGKFIISGLKAQQQVTISP